MLNIAGRLFVWGVEISELPDKQELAMYGLSIQTLLVFTVGQHIVVPTEWSFRRILVMVITRTNEVNSTFTNDVSRLTQIGTVRFAFCHELERSDSHNVTNWTVPIFTLS